MAGHTSTSKVGVGEVSTVWADIGKIGDGGERQLPRNRFSFSLDSDQKDQLIEVIEKLLADKTTVCTWARTDGWWKGAGVPLPFLFTLSCHCPFPSWWRAAW